MNDLTIRGHRLLTTRGIQSGCVQVRRGVIKAISGYDDVAGDVPVIDAGYDVVMAGLVDTHVHVNEPGRTEWEGFASATRAAAAGGVTTLFDMPLNSIPATTTLAALDTKRDAARGRVSVNVGFIGGVVPGNAGELPVLYTAGVRLFKCFLVPSGVEEFPAVTEADLRLAMPVLSMLRDARLLVHAELPQFIDPIPHGDPRRYATYLASRPPSAETEAIKLMIRLADEFNVRVHIVHLSSADSLPLLSAARHRGTLITAETCPHYLTFAAEEIADGRTELKCAPPIRDAAAREALWSAVMDGELGMIVSDHSPCPPDMKARSTGDFFEAWGGIASLQLRLPAIWHEARARGASLEHIEEWLCRAPSRLSGLHHCKGRLAAGYDADIVIWDPEEPVDVDAVTLYHRHPITPYRGRTLTGAVHATFVGGVEVFRNGSIVANAPGTLISPDTYLPRLHD